MRGHPVTSRNFDVIIVGGGIIGLSLAFEMTRRNLNWRVAVLGTASNSTAASPAAGAMLSGFGETTAHTRATPAGRAKAAWRAQAAGLWPAWVEALDTRSEVRLQEGTVILLNAISGALDNRNFESIVDALAAGSEPFESVDPLSLAGLRPTDSGRPLRAIYLPNERFVDASTVIHSLTGRLEEDGNTGLYQARCLSIDPAGNGNTAHRITTDAGTFCASRVIVAAGAESLDFIGLDQDAKRRIPPLVAGVGTSLVCSAPAAAAPLEFAVRTPNRSFACGLHALPGNRGGVYIGSTNNIHSRRSTKPLLSDISFLIQCAAQQIDRRLQASELLSVLSGCRPVTADTFPLAGETSVKGLWLLTGTYRDGFHLSPLLAKLMVDALECGAGALAGGEMFVPERPPLADMPALPAAIAQGVDNYIGIAFERGAVFPGDGYWEDEFREAAHRRVTELYGRFSSRFLPPPDLLWDIEHTGLGTLLDTYYSESEQIWTQR